MNLHLNLRGLSATSRRRELSMKPSVISKTTARNVLAPYLRRGKSREKGREKGTEDDRRRGVRKNIRRIQDDTSKLCSFCKEDFEVPTVINETSEILREVTKSFGVSSYIVDDSEDYIILTPKYMPQNGRHTVKYKIEPEKTVAAYVAFSREFVMVDDILGDMRFPQGIAGRGKTVKSVLCVPVLTAAEGKCIAVIELYRNVDQKPYTSLDAQICVSMTGWMGAAIHHNSQRLFILKKHELHNYLLSLIESFFSGTLDFDKFISNIVESAKMTVEAERGSFYISDEEILEGTEDDIVVNSYEEGIHQVFYTFKKRNKERFPKRSTDLVSSVMRQGKTINVVDALNDPRTRKGSDFRGNLTYSVVCVPIKANKGVFGALQLSNKQGEGHFLEEDEEILEFIARHVYLACRHNFIKINYGKLIHRFAGSQELLKIHIKPCPDDLQVLRSTPIITKSKLPKGFMKFHWLVGENEEQAPQYVIFMFDYLLGNRYFNYDRLTEFVLMVKKSYRGNPYHNFDHAFTVLHCMFNIIIRNEEKFTEIQVLALLVATICHDCDHVGLTNNFLEMTNHWLAEIYWESPLEHHHVDICRLMIESSDLFANLTLAEQDEAQKIISLLILATDLVQYFQNRNELIELLKAKKFDWDLLEHRMLFFKIMMTVCDVSGQCKPFDSARRVTEGLYREFYNQGDLEKNLGFSPLSMMDRERTSSIPENQVHFLTLVCIPSTSLLVSVLPNTEELLQECMNSKDCWSCIQDNKPLEFWKQSTCLNLDSKCQKKLSRRSTRGRLSRLVD